MPLCFEFSFIDPLTETNSEGQKERDWLWWMRRKRKSKYLVWKTKHWHTTRIREKRNLRHFTSMGEGSGNVSELNPRD